VALTDKELYQKIIDLTTQFIAWWRWNLLSTQDQTSVISDVFLSFRKYEQKAIGQEKKYLFVIFRSELLGMWNAKEKMKKTKLVGAEQTNDENESNYSEWGWNQLRSCTQPEPGFDQEILMSHLTDTTK